MRVKRREEDFPREEDSGEDDEFDALELDDETF